MEFDKSRVYTIVNADELKVGSKVIVADSLGLLKRLVELSDKANIHKLTKICDCNAQHRFKVDNGYDCEYALCYLLEEPTSLKWTDLKIGDVIRRKGEIRMITGISTVSDGSEMHIFNGTNWLTDEELEDWEKVEE